jgi:hypothetical protein
MALNLTGKSLSGIGINYTEVSEGIQLLVSMFT